ncbi:unnamed protein product [Rotaria socialis]|uniref:F-box domain-containing protein n=2 Tax=Rotaria socialis TaxID=392032 RepID=A0A818EJG2_9BILA|nr:unnamed protein product [Rotaria socialis]CAF4691724.1 unnamed protein product [Rotaria socialis]
MNMKFESLPNEMLFEIFEYLDALHLLGAFYGLNARFNKFLNDSFKLYRLDFRSVSKTNFTTVCQLHLPSITDKIISLYLTDDDETPNLPEIFLSYNFTLDQFVHLKSLSLQLIQSHDVLSKILVQCHRLSYLTHLKLIECVFNNEENYLVNNIWSLPKLINCHIDDIMPNGLYFSKLSVKSTSIKYLSMKNIICDLVSLTYVLEQTPCLERFNAAIISTEKNEKLHIRTSVLIGLHLSFRGSIQTMMNLFQQLCNLRYLTLTTTYLILNGHEWQNILSQYLPKVELFRLKMDFHFRQGNNIECKIDELLDTFQTHFWIIKHRWFVRCDWNPSNAFNQASLYTLPYAFDDLNFISESNSKSTCPNKHDFSCYNHVRTLQIESTASNHFVYFPIQFSNISHLEIFLPFNEQFLCNIPSLDRLKSLDVTLLPGDTVYDQLQLLLDRAPRLHLLRFSHLSDLESRLFEIHNASIRRLEFFTKESMLYSWYFDKQQCLSLANSSLGRQCQTLVVDVNDRNNVNDLIKNMKNLQSLVCQCKEDKWTHRKISSVNDEFIQWLTEHLPSTCSISRNAYENSIIQMWIR